MNKYSRTFVSVCPSNHASIIYSLVIESEKMIYVEHINTAVAIFRKDYHEKIADELFKAFGGKQTITAHHHGVDVETKRGFEEICK